MGRSGLVWLCVMGSLAAACQRHAKVDHPARKPSSGKAVLPPTPNLAPELPPDRYADGTWSVHGLLAADKQALPKSLDVRGTVAVLHPCAMTEKVCNPAPYLQLTDAKTGHGRRLLVGGERDLDAWNLQVGQEVVLRGHFAQGSADGVWFAPQGMLLVTPLPTGADGRRTR